MPLHPGKDLVVDDPIVDALGTFVTAVLADAFDLTPEETIWVRAHLAETFSPLAGRTVDQVPLQVSQEISTEAFSRRLAERDEAGSGSARIQPAGVRYAGAEEWAAVIMQIVEQCYAPRPLDESGMRGRLIGLLRELGVGRADAPRASTHLPAEVIHLLNRRSRDLD